MKTAKTRDAAPLPHLRHLSAEQRRVTAEIGGTPRGLRLAANIDQWVVKQRALASAVEAQAQMVAQSLGTGHMLYVETASRAEKFRRLAEHLEAEAAALRTTHMQQQVGDDAYERYRHRVQDAWKS